ncbi:hypothetical protein ADUPG1_011890 [Aduncisulcus paluster]|uniref:EGF-like domain-containing protein n=1 Tax=Aduncisulcus paluster TaxID=2918883 RepID=A0ABQ5JXJ2_9EUKA|nr:hypothetical protein ADUPG1_011890 [Aduncisulcus paluster]
MARLFSVNLPGGTYSNDISSFYRNVDLTKLSTHDDDYYIPLCRVEDDSQFKEYLGSVFPHMAFALMDYLKNDCPLNPTDSNNCNGVANCPSLVLNEVYNAYSESAALECNEIAKKDVSSGSLVCYTVHDDNLRSYLKKTYLDISEDNGIIAVGSIRSRVTGRFDMYNVTGGYGPVSTLQGLEYATSLSYIELESYDLSGNSQLSAYDQTVVKILARFSNARTNELTYLGLSDCGISRIDDILDLNPITNADPHTTTFNLASLDISHNSLSDLSELITSDMFDKESFKDGINLNDNNICDIQGFIEELNIYFDEISIIQPYSDQLCQCSEAISSSSHLICREIYPDLWIADCWKGYYLDKGTNQCVKACALGYSLDTGTNECTVEDDSIQYSNSSICRLCESEQHKISILEKGNAHVTCSCMEGWSGDDCSTCAEGYVGDLCQYECPMVNGNICNNQGQCQMSADGLGSECVCFSPSPLSRSVKIDYEEEFESVPGGNTNSRYIPRNNPSGILSTVVYPHQYVGDSCQYQCPQYGPSYSVCGTDDSHGVCVFDETYNEAICHCDPGYTGTWCSKECNCEHGTCFDGSLDVFDSDATCDCPWNYQNNTCSSVSGTFIVVLGIGIVILGVIGGVIVCWCHDQREKEKSTHSENRGQYSPFEPDESQGLFYHDIFSNM